MPATPQPKPDSGSSLRILIVDDHPLVRRGSLELLTQEYPRLKVGEAGDSREAVDLLAKQDWDLLLLDINMPGRNGLDVLEEARKIRPRIPVLILSAYPEEEFAVRAFKLGAAGYLNKQCVPDELVAAVRKILAGGKYVTASLAEHLAALLGGEICQAPHEALSSRELRVMQMIAAGRTLKEIAAELSLSEKTVGTYRARIAQKTGLASNVEITRYAVQHKLVG
jgi:DNA-binding NarL/FixJ family response regulator